MTATHSAKLCRCRRCLKSHIGGKVVGESTFYTHRRREQREQERGTLSSSSTQSARRVYHCVCRDNPDGHFLSRAQLYQHRQRLRIIEESRVTGDINAYGGDISDGDAELSGQDCGIDSISEAGSDHNVSIEEEYEEDEPESNQLHAALNQLLEDQPFGFTEFEAEDTSMYYSYVVAAFILIY